MSRAPDPSRCPDCRAQKMRAVYPRSRPSPVQGVSISLSGVSVSFGSFSDFAHPDEHDDTDRCANLNCDEGRDQISKNLGKVDKGLAHAAQMGDDWTLVDEDHIVLIEQLSERGMEIPTGKGIQWTDLDSKMEIPEHPSEGIEWTNATFQGEMEEMRDLIDAVKQHGETAIEHAKAIDPSEILGTDRTSEIEALTDTLDELRDHTYVNDVVVVETVREVERITSEEIVPAQESTPTQRREEEEQDVTNQEPGEMSKAEVIERLETVEAENQRHIIEKQDLRADNYQLREDKQTLKEENQTLEAENEEQVETIQGLTAENENLIDDKTKLLEKIDGLTNDKIELSDRIQQLNEENRELRDKNQEAETARERETSSEPSRGRPTGADPTNSAGEFSATGGENDPPTDAEASPDPADGHIEAENTASSTKAYLPYDADSLPEDGRVIEGIEYDGPQPDLPSMDSSENGRDTDRAPEKDPGHSL